MGRVLAVDWGRKRRGVAISDPSRTMAFPREVVETLDDAAAIARIAALAREEEVDLIVVGLPVNVDGTEGGAAAEVRAFAGRLAEAAGMPVELFDESYTTLEAEALLRPHVKGRRNRRSKVDKVAAQVLLTGWLAAQGGGA